MATLNARTLVYKIDHCVLKKEIQLITKLATRKVPLMVNIVYSHLVYGIKPSPVLHEYTSQFGKTSKCNYLMAKGNVKKVFLIKSITHNYFVQST